jgi:C2 domain
LEIVSANIFINTEEVGEMDPFVVVSCSYNKKKEQREVKYYEEKTPTKQEAGRNPQWEHSFNEIKLHKSVGFIQFRLFDEDVHKNDYIGEIKLPIRDLASLPHTGKNNTVCLELTGSDKRDGEQIVTALLFIRPQLIEHKSFEDNKIG